MNKRLDRVLINPTEKERFEREPLLKFSFYLSGRNNVLLSLASEIVELLDEGFSSSPINGDRVGRASILMWLWTLGAYEVVRTMCQAKKCFSNTFFKRISGLKKTLTEVRMPAAKMEKKGKKEPVASNRNPDGWDVAKKDLLINDPEARVVSARMLLEKYEEVMYSLKVEDVLKNHREAYNE
ncbi:MAG: hypothetical protein ACYS1A_08985 [Planctomycetota bacterium]|jgi:hypothetical protein